MSSKTFQKDRKDPLCPYCQDDGKPCARCGTGMPKIKPGASGLTSTPFSSLDLQTGWKSQPKLNREGMTCTGHDGKKLAFELRDGKVRIYGAQGSKLANGDVSHLDLILDLAGLVKPRRFILSGPRRFTGLNPIAYPDVVSLHWPDMTAPKHVHLPFWIRLLEQLQGDVAIACMGSHGRTGTAMAALLVADGKAADEAMQIVRSKHCGRAIETAEQESYIRDLGKR